MSLNFVIYGDAGTNLHGYGRYNIKGKHHFSLLIWSEHCKSEDQEILQIPQIYE